MFKAEVFRACLFRGFRFLKVQGFDRVLSSGLQLGAVFLYQQAINFGYASIEIFIPEP